MIDKVRWSTENRVEKSRRAKEFLANRIPHLTTAHTVSRSCDVRLVLLFLVIASFAIVPNNGLNLATAD